MTHHVVTLAPLALEGSPIPIPREFGGLSASSLADLSWVGAPLRKAWVGKGLWPVIEERVALDADERHVASPTYEIDAAAKAVRAVYAAEAKPAEVLKAERKAAIDARLAATDAGMARVVEELAEGATLSPAARAKIDERKALRQERAALE